MSAHKKNRIIATEEDRGRATEHPPSQQDVIERIIDHCNLRAPTRGPPPRSTMPDISIDPVISIGCENFGFFPDPIYDA